MIEIKIDGITKWQVSEYTFTDPQMGVRSISLTVTHPSDNATVPSFVGAYVEYDGERYDIVNSKPTAEKGIDSINYKYNLIFNGQEAELQRRKIRNLATVGVDAFISQGTSFSLYADINQFKQLLENNLKYYFGNRWTINLGSTTSESVMVSVNNMSIWDLLLKTFEYYGLRWNITGNTMNIGYTHDVIQHVFDYGYNGGLVKITRTAQSEPTINRLVGVGGSRNVPINYFTNRYSGFPVDPNPISGDVNIKNIMPKVFRDSVIAGTLPYIDYVEDAALVASEGVKEDALEPNEDIYPSIAGVEVAGLGRIDQIIAASVPTANNPDDAGYSPTFDIWVKDIGFDLSDNQYTTTQDAKISFTSGMLAGYEFVILATNGVRNVVVDTTKSHGGVSSKYKITLINSSEDFTATGRMLPNSVIKAMGGDSFVIYDIIMPQTYVELAELRVQNWLNEQLDVKKVEKPTYAIEPTDTFFEENIAPESDGKTIREKLKSGNKLTVNNTKVTDGAQELHINNITIQYGGLLPKYSFVVTDKVSVQGSAIARLTNEIQKTDNSVKDSDRKIAKLQQYSDRQWKDIQETLTLLGQAVDGFSTGINPITIQTMQIITGSESLQFRFVNSKTTPVLVSHAFNWDSATEQFGTLSGIIQHMTLGITKISSSHPVSAYKFWDMASYSNNTLVPEKPYYLYAKCSRTTSGGVFILSDVAIGMKDDANYYHFLVGILNSQDADNERSFVSLYGYTEILPGRITTDRIVSSDGLTYFDLVNGIIGGKIRFLSAGSETDLDTWATGTSQDIQDAQSAANAAALAAQQAIDDAEAKIDAEKARINDILSDNVADPSEKQYLANLWQEVYAEYPMIWAQADALGVDYSYYSGRYTSLNSDLSLVLADLTTSTTISGEIIRSAFSQYYEARTQLLNNITSKVNNNAIGAQLTAEQAQFAADGYIRARYVRDWLNGSSVGVANTWNELKVVNRQGTNLAQGKTPVTNGTFRPQQPATNITDNNITTSSGTTYGSTPALDFVVIDLGQVYYDIEYIQVFHYHADGRICYGTKTEVSVDGINWSPVFDSAKSGTYKETEAGKTHTFRPHEVAAKLNRAAAITDKFGTTVEGGLIQTVIALFRELNSSTETAGTSGIQGDGTLPAFWAGGTHAQAIADLAKIILRHDGSGQLAGGKIKWNASGNLEMRGLLAQSFERFDNANALTNYWVLWEDDYSLSPLTWRTYNIAANKYSGSLFAILNRKTTDVRISLNSTFGGVRNYEIPPNKMLFGLCVPQAASPQYCAFYPLCPLTKVTGTPVYYIVDSYVD